MLALITAVAFKLIPPTEVPAEAGWFATLVAAVFDPTWNLENRRAIWATIVVVLFLSGIGLPLPEDIPLTLAGFTTLKSSHDVFVFWRFVLAFVAVTIPILTGDVLAYTLGRRFGLGIRDRIPPLRRLVSEKRMARVQRWFDNYGSFTVFLGRQVAGVRFVTFFMAGTMRVPLSRFVFFDFLGCLVSVPVWLSLGVLASRYGEEWLRAAMRKVGSGFLIGTIVLLLVFLLVIKLRGSLKPKPALEPKAEEGK